MGAILRLTTLDQLNKNPKVAVLLSPVQYVSSLVLLVLVFVMFLSTLVAGIAYLAMYWWYNPGVFAGVKNVCQTGGMCNKYCSGDAMHCCVIGFHQAHKNAWDVVKGDFSNVKDAYGAKNLTVLPELARGMDPEQIGNLLSGYFERHPVQCIQYDEFEREEYLAKMGKKYGGALFGLLFAAAMCYNYCTVYVFEVNWALLKTTFDGCLSCCSSKAKEPEPLTEPLLEEQALTEALQKGSDGAASDEHGPPRPGS